MPHNRRYFYQKPFLSTIVVCLLATSFPYKSFASGDVIPSTLDIHSSCLNKIDSNQKQNVAIPVARSLQLDSRIEKNILNSLKKNPGHNLGEQLPEYYTDWGWTVRDVTSELKSHRQSKGSTLTTIAIIDSGIDDSHPALSQNIVSDGRSFVPGEEGTRDQTGHGTMVAGMIAAKGKISSIAPSIGIVPYKVFGKAASESEWVIKAIKQATKDGVDVINLSLGTYKDPTNKEDNKVIKAYEKAIKYAHKKGVVVVASSGTDGYSMDNQKDLAKKIGNMKRAMHLPGGLKNTITVGATNRLLQPTEYSNYGKKVDLSAPAGDYGPDWSTSGIADIKSFVLTTYPTYLPQSPISQALDLDQGYEFMIGTSLASPQVAAVAALLIDVAKSKGINLSPDTVEHLLKKSTTPFLYPDDKRRGGTGIVNATNALHILRNLIENGSVRK